MLKPILATKSHAAQVFLEGRRLPVTVLRLSDQEVDQLKAGEVLAVGDRVKVTGISKGKGFAGVVKRHGFAGGPATHGQSDRLRAPGSISRGTTPGRVLPGKKMPGRLGGQTVTIRNLKVVNVDLDRKTLTISGLVPGSRNALLKITVLS